MDTPKTKWFWQNRGLLPFRVAGLGVRGQFCHPSPQLPRQVPGAAVVPTLSSPEEERGGSARACACPPRASTVPVWWVWLPHLFGLLGHARPGPTCRPEGPGWSLGLRLGVPSLNAEGPGTTERRAFCARPAPEPSRWTGRLTSKTNLNVLGEKVRDLLIVVPWGRPFSKKAEAEIVNEFLFVHINIKNYKRKIF